MEKYVHINIEQLLIQMCTQIERALSVYHYKSYQILQNQVKNQQKHFF